MKTHNKLCPKCRSEKFVISVFGSICGDCFYEEKEAPKDNLLEKEIRLAYSEILSESQIQATIIWWKDIARELLQSQKEEMIKKIENYFSNGEHEIILKDLQDLLK